MSYHKKVGIFLSIVIIISICEGSVWKPIIPQARDHARIIIDSLNKRAILFGGSSWQLDNRLYNDVWEISLVDSSCYYWKPLQVTGISPKERAAGLFIYDQPRQRAILFGGDTLWAYRVNDLWTLNLTKGVEFWQQLSPEGTPPTARTCCGAIFHPGRNSIILFGGEGDITPVFNDVWELKLDPLRWQEINITGVKPPARGAPAVAFDHINNRMVIFGGGCRGSGPFYNDVWALDLTEGNEHWTQLFPTGDIPSTRTAFAYGFDEERNKLYIFGGWNNSGLLDEVYRLDISNLAWSKLLPSGVGPYMRRNAQGAYDFFNDNFIVYGGNLEYAYYVGDCYILNLETSVGNLEWNSSLTINIRPIILVNSLNSPIVYINYILPKPDNIKVDIIDIKGRIVKQIFSGKTTSINGRLEWNKKNEHNQTVSTGIYFCRLETEEHTLSKKFTILK